MRGEQDRIKSAGMGGNAAAEAASAAMRRIKEALDPLGIMNLRKVVWRSALPDCFAPR